MIKFKKNSLNRFVFLVVIAILLASSFLFIRGWVETYAIGADTYIRSGSPNSNYGTQIYVRFNNIGYKGLVYRDYMNDYDQYGPIVIGSTIYYAYLNVYHSGGSSSDTIYAYPMMVNWSESAATWNTRLGLSVANWSTPGMAAGVDYNNTAAYVSSVQGDISAWRQLDVTKWVNETVWERQPNYGWMLLASDTTDQDISSRESGTSHDPYLNISMAYPSPPYVNLTPNHTDNNIVVPYYTSNPIVNFTCGIDWSSITTKHNVSGLGFSLSTGDGDNFYIDYFDGSDWVYWNETSTPVETYYANINWTYNFSTVGDGIYYWECAGDIVYNVGLGIGWTSSAFYNTTEGLVYFDQIIYDTTVPNITFVDPTPSAGGKNSGNSVTINVSHGDITPDTCILIWNNTATVTNYTMTKIGDYCNYTLPTVDATKYYYKVWVNDTLGHSSITTLRNFTENSEPTVPKTVTMTPITAYNNATLNCTASGSTDAESDPLTYYYQFSNASTVLQAYGTENIFACIENYCKKGTVINCSAKAYDGSGYSPVNSTTLTTLNSLPVINAWNISNSTWSTSSGTNIDIYENATNGTYVFNITNVTDQDDIYIWCYQESSNVSTSCGGKSTGTYSGSATSNIVYVTYAKPNNSTVDSLLQIKMGTAGTVQNISIPQACWDYSATQLAFEITTSVAITTVYCNSGSWTQIATNGNSGNTGGTASTWTNLIDGNWDTYAAYDSGSVRWEIHTLNEGSFWEEAMNWRIQVESETHWYDWFIDGVKHTVNTVQSWFSWVLGSDTVGSHNVTVVVNDTSNGQDTQYWNVTIHDVTNPNIIIAHPTANTYYSNNASIPLNFTITDVHRQTCWYNLNNGANTTIASCANITFGVANGVYNLTLYTNDTSGNTNYSTVSNIYVDSILPRITITYPANTSYTTAVTALNYTYIEVYPSLCWYSTDGGVTNTSLTCGTNKTGLTASQGSNKWMIKMQDSAGNGNQTYVTFFVDSANPTINFTEPTETTGSYLNRNNIVVNVTATDASLANITIYLYNSDKSLNRSNTTTTSPNYINYTGLANGVYYFNATAYDSLSNKNSTETRNVTIDTVYPLISYTTGMDVNSANKSQNYIFINTSWTEINFKNITFKANANSQTFTTSTTNYTFSGLSNGVYYYNATICDLANWCNTTTTYIITLDTTAPNATLIFPSNNTYNSSLSQNFTFNASDNLGIKNATLFINNETGSFNQTNIDFTSGTLSRITGIVVTLREGIYKWWVTVRDWAGNTFTTQNNTLTIDTTNPRISLVYPINTSYNSIQTTLNFTVSDTNLNTCWYSTDAGATNTTTSCTANKTGLTSNQGSNVWLVGVNDSANNKNQSTVTFFVDSIKPTINFTGQTPGNNTYQTSTSVTVNFTGTEVNFQSGWISWNNVNYTANCTGTAPYYCNYTFSALANNQYNYIAYANDSVGNINQTEQRRVTVDTTYPLISYGTNSESDGNNVSRSNIYLNVSVTETNEKNITFTLRNLTSPVNSTTYTTSQRTINWTGLPSTDYNYNVTVCDQVNYCNTTISRTIRLDTVAPNATLISPTNNSYNSTTSQNFTSNITDNLGIKNATLTIYNETGFYNETSVTITPTVTQKILGIVVNLFDGVYKWWMKYFDTAGNSYTTQNNTLTIDTIAASGSIAYPLNTTYTYVITALNFSISDLHLSSCWYSINGGTTNISTSCTSNITGLNSGQGSSTWMVASNDSAGNKNASYVTFFVDSINPTINLTSPTESTGAYLNRNNIVVNVTSTDTNLANITIYLYNSDHSLNRSNVSISSPYFINYTALSDGIYYFNSTVRDILNNVNSTETRNVTIDITKPLIDWGTNTAAHWSNLSQSHIYANVTWTEMNFKNITFILKNDTATVNSTTFTTATYNINWTGLPDGNYTYYVNITDLAENTNSTLIRYILIDDTLPSATLIAPSNNEYNSTTSQNFTATITDNTGIKNVTLFIYNQSNDLINQTTVSYVSSITTTVVGVVVDLAENVLHWFYRVYDWAGNSYQTGNNTLTIDTTKPLISYNPSTTANGTWVTDGIIVINVTATDTNLNQVRFQWQVTNETFDSSSGSIYWESITSLTTGTYTFYAWANDLAGNYNSTVIRTIHVDREDPVVNIERPLPINYNVNTSLPLNISFGDTNLNTCWWNIDNGPNTTIACGSNYTFNTSEGTHTLYAFANDSANRVGNDNLTFAVNLAPPSITIDAPDDDQWLSSTNVTIQWTPSDTDGISTCELWGSWGTGWHLNESISSVTSGIQITRYKTITEGVSYLLNVRCNDTGNNWAWGNPLNNNTFNIDSAAPVITYDAATTVDQLNQTATNIYVKVDVTEANEETITFTLYDSTGVENVTSSASGLREVNWTGLDDDTYYFNVTINDSAGNVQNTTTRTVRIDTTGPDITLNTPETINYNYNDSLVLNTTITDAIVGVDTCWFSIENETGYTFYNNIVYDCVNYTFSLPSGDINYIVIIYANDTLGNLENFGRTFGIRTERPAIVLNNPTNNKNINRLTNIQFNVTPSDREGIDTCKLYGNWSSGWHLNQTLTSVTEGAVNNFNLLNISEGTYIWNAWCNDTNGWEDWALNNLTFVLDVTKPGAQFITGNNTAVSTSFAFDYNITDLHLDDCYYNFYSNSTGWVFTPNQTLSCTATTKSTSVAAGTYNLYIWAYDLAGNTNSSIITITASGPSAPPGSSGTSPEPVVGNLSWGMFTNEQKSMTSYKFEMVSGGIRDREIYFFNDEAKEIEVSLTCEDGDLCQYLTLDKNNITIPVALEIPTIVNFHLELPVDIEKGSYVMNIKATDQDGQEKVITISANVGIAGVTIEAFTKLGASKNVFGLPVPYILISIFVMALTFVLFNFVFFRNIKLGLPLSIVIALFMGIFILFLL